MAIYTYQTHIRYDDIDSTLQLSLRGAMGLMQEAAILHSSLSGYSIMDVEHTHLSWVLVQWRIRMVGSAAWNEQVTVHTWPATMERLKSMRNFEIRNTKGEQIAIGESVWVLVNADTGRTARITPEVAAAYDLTDRFLFDDPTPSLPAGEGVLTHTDYALHRDIDTNHHVNNRVYLDYAREALPEAVADSPFREILIRYRRQLLLGDPVCCYYQSQGNCHVVDICGTDREHVHATVLVLT